MVKGINAYWAKFGVDLGITEESVLVQIWWASPDCENWNAHGHEVFRFVPGYLPFSMVMDVADGDTIDISTNQGDIVLTANQGDYRYRNFGPFHSVVNRMVR